MKTLLATSLLLFFGCSNDPTVQQVFTTDTYTGQVVAKDGSRAIVGQSAGILTLTAIDSTTYYGLITTSNAVGQGASISDSLRVIYVDTINDGIQRVYVGWYNGVVWNPALPFDSVHVSGDTQRTIFTIRGATLQGGVTGGVEWNLTKQ